MSALKPIGSIPMDQRRYHITNILGRGGFGTVYRARLEGSDGFQKDVAIKILKDTEPEPEILARFRDEARILGLVRYPNIVNVDPPVRLHGRWAVVMEYVDGISCDELLQAGALPPQIALDIAETVALTLDHLWNALDPDGKPLHLLHRDLKPSNIQITPSGHVKVLDFGVAWGEFAGRETQTLHNIGGTPGYIAPERLEGQTGSDQVSGDVYSLGIMLHKLVTRNRGKRGDTAADLTRDVAKVIELAIEMHSPDPEARPTPSEVARRCRTLRAAMTPLDLREWAKANVPPCPQRPPDAMVGQTLSETMSHVVAREPAAGGGGAPFLLAGLVSVSVGGVVVLGGLIVLIVGVVLWAARPEEVAVLDPALPEPVPVIEPVDPPVPDAVAPEPAPVPSRPRPPRPRPPPAPKVDQGTVVVTGEASTVVLACGGSTFKPGPVPAGTCDIRASFAGEPPAAAGRVVVPSNGKITVECLAAFQRCRER